MLKPHLVVETGSYQAHTSTQLALALRENANAGFPGRLLTFETDAGRAEFCAAQLRDLPAEVVNAPCYRHDFGVERVDVAFIDSAYDTRKLDMMFLTPIMSAMGVMFLHDMSLQGEWKGELANFVTGKFNAVQFATPRGLWALQPRGGLWSYGRAL